MTTTTTTRNPPEQARPVRGQRPQDAKQAVYSGTRRQHPGARFAAKPCREQGRCEIRRCRRRPAPESTDAACEGRRHQAHLPRTLQNCERRYSTPPKSALPRTSCGTTCTPPTSSRRSATSWTRATRPPTLPPVSAPPKGRAAVARSWPASVPPCSRATATTKLTLEQVMAFAVSDDHAAQEHVLENLRPHQRDPRIIRDALTENEIPAGDRRVKFVTLKAYEKAGGQTRTDLFTQGDESIFILDPALARPAGEGEARPRNQAACQGRLEMDGRPTPNSAMSSVHNSGASIPRPWPCRASSPMKRRNSKRNSRSSKSSGRVAGEDAEYPDRCDEIRDRLDEIERSREREWTAEKLAIAGAIAVIGNDGKLQIERGFVRPEDMPKGQERQVQGRANRGPDGQPGKASRRLSPPRSRKA